MLGAGTWGVALARMLSNNGHAVMVWSALSEEIDQLVSSRIHNNLSYMRIPDEVVFTKSMAAVCGDKDVLIFAVPSIFVRNTARQANPYIKDGQVIVDVAKGIEAETLMTLTEVIQDEIAANINVVALSDLHMQRRLHEICLLQLCQPVKILKRQKKYKMFL